MRGPSLYLRLEMFRRLPFPVKHHALRGAPRWVARQKMPNGQRRASCSWSLALHRHADKESEANVEKLAVGHKNMCRTLTWTEAKELG